MTSGLAVSLPKRTATTSGRCDVKNKRNLLSVERLKELLHYNPDSGVFTWVGAGYRQERRIGSVAGCLDPTGYIRIGIDGTQYWAHRLAWLYVKGEQPNGVIDHWNRIKSDNRISNLRDVTHQANIQNMASREGRSLPRGVSKKRSKYVSGITIDGKRVHLGTFITPEEAHHAYLAAKAKYHQEWNSVLTKDRSP